jgi:hypothetical protein
MEFHSIPIPSSDHICYQLLDICLWVGTCAYLVSCYLIGDHGEHNVLRECRVLC